MECSHHQIPLEIPDEMCVKPHQITVDHQSPYLKTKSHRRKTWFELYVLGSGFVAGWKRLAFATVWGVVACFLTDKWLEVEYPSIFPVSTLPFTIATFILAPILGLFINYNSTKFIDAMKFYKLTIVQTQTMAISYAAGMRGYSTPAVDEVRHILAAFPFVMKHQLRMKSTLREAPLYNIPENDQNADRDESNSYHNLTADQEASLKRAQNEVNRWAYERGLAGAAYNEHARGYTMSGLQVSKLPWPYQLRIEALNLRIIKPLDVVGFLMAKIDNSAPTAGVTGAIINALMTQLNSMTTLFGNVHHLRNTRVPVVVSNILYLGIILYLMFLPLAFWDYFRWFTLLPYLLTAFFMLGLLSATEQLANPFGRFQTSNAIYRDIGRRAHVGHQEIWHTFTVSEDASIDTEKKSSRTMSVKR